MTSQPLPESSRIAAYNALQYLSSPYRFYERAFGQHGDTFLFHGPNGPVVLTRNPEHVKTIFTLDTSQIGIYPEDGIDVVTGPNSILVITNEKHRRERKLLGPPFHGARMRAYGQVMQKAVQQEMRSWREGEVVDFQGAMQRISLSVIANAVFGLADPEESARTQKLAVTYMESLSPLMLFFPALRREYFGFKLFAKTYETRREMENALAARIAESRSRPPSEDILSMMIHAHYDDGSTMSDAQIQDELFTLLLAGHETTALGLSWMFYHLYRNPETLVKLRQELHALGAHPEAEAIAQCRYLDACANESLRLYPVVAETFRKLRVPIELGPYTVPAGHAVSVSAIGVHHNPAIYPNPQRFRPERFLEHKFTPFEFVPFGGGTRRCLGAAFANYEMKLVAHEILSHAELALANDKEIKPVMRGATFGPKGGVPMRVLRLSLPQAGLPN